MHRRPAEVRESERDEVVVAVEREFGRDAADATIARCTCSHYLRYLGRNSLCSFATSTRRTLTAHAHVLQQIFRRLEGGELMK